MNGCFINLQRSGDRRTAMEAQLRALGIEGVARFEAIDAATLPTPGPDAATSAGERACFLSHARAPHRDLLAHWPNARAPQEPAPRPAASSSAA